MDRDGTNDGYDLALTRAVADAVPVPVIASGGAGELAPPGEAIAEGGADAVLCASIFHYGSLPGARGQGAPRRRRDPGPALGAGAQVFGEAGDAAGAEDLEAGQFVGLALRFA